MKIFFFEKISVHKVDFENLNEVEQNLYLMVARVYLAQFYPPHEYKSTKVTISFADEKFVVKGKNIKNMSEIIH